MGIAVLCRGCEPLRRSPCPRHSRSSACADVRFAAQGSGLRATSDRPHVRPEARQDTTAVPTSPTCIVRRPKDPIPTGKGRSDLRGRPVLHRKSSVGSSDVGGTGVLLVPCPVTRRMLATARKGRGVTAVGCRARSCAAARAAARLSSQQGAAAPAVTAAARGQLTLVVTEPSSGDYP